MRVFEFDFASTKRRGFSRIVGGVMALVIAASIASPPRPAAAQVDILVGAATLGGALDKLTGAVNSMINHAAEQADKVQFAIANSLLTDLSIAKQAFQQTLDHNLAQLTAVESQTLGALESAYAKLEAKTFADAETALDHVQDVLDQIPFFNRDPQVRAVTPRYLVTTPTPGAIVTIALRGNFPDSAVDGYRPTLVTGGHSFDAAATINQLTFNVPLSILSDRPVPSAVVATTAVVSIPFHHCYFLIFNCKHNSGSNINLGLLPPSPGSITYSISQPATRTVYKTVQTPQLNQNSADGDHINNCYHYPPDAGWTVIPSSVGIAWSRSGWSEIGADGNCSGPAGAGWSMTTRQEHCVFGICAHGGDGNISFHMTFLEMQDQNYTATSTSSLVLNWNEQRVIDIPTTASWTLTLNRFDGVVLQATQAAGFSNDFVTVSPKVGAIVIGAYPFGVGYTQVQKTNINQSFATSRAIRQLRDSLQPISASLPVGVQISPPPPTPSPQPVTIFGP